MKRLFQHIFSLLVLSMISLSLYSCREDGIIDEEDMSQIYAEMLLTDQWINNTPGVRLIADTSLVYEPILRKYGYTSADYRRSVEFYLKDAEDYADIMDGTIDILNERLKGLKKQKEQIQGDKDREAFVKKVAKGIKFDRAWLFVERLKNERYGMIDSLSVEWDTVGYYYKMVPVQWSEKKHNPDSLAVLDSLVVLDSLSISDSLSVLDSLNVVDSLMRSDSLHVVDSLQNADSLTVIDTLPAKKTVKDSVRFNFPWKLKTSGSLTKKK